MFKDETKTTKKEFVVAEDVAIASVDDWLESVGFVRPEDDELSEEEIKSFKINKNTLVRAVKEGRLTFNDDDTAEYTISQKSAEGYRGNKLNIALPTGRFWTATDGYKDNQNMKKLQSCVSVLTGKDIGYFQNIFAGDWKVLQAVVIFFMNI